MTRWQTQVFMTCMFGSLVAAAQTAPKATESRGELLYATYCTSCHTTEVHWRDKKLATDWATLKAQVRRWSTNTGLAWSEGDVLAVTRHLNTLYYHFSDATGQVSLLSPSPRPAR
jgi:mono/diheme cytochrome c family protein